MAPHAWNAEGTKPQSGGETDTAGGGVTWKAASGAQSSMAEVGPVGEPGLGVKPEGLVGGSNLHEQHWRFAEEEEGSGAERIRRNTGSQIFPAA